MVFNEETQRQFATLCDSLRPYLEDTDFTDYSGKQKIRTIALTLAKRKDEIKKNKARQGLIQALERRQFNAFRKSKQKPIPTFIVVQEFHGLNGGQRGQRAVATIDAHGNITCHCDNPFDKKANFAFVRQYLSSPKIPLRIAA